MSPLLSWSEGSICFSVKISSLQQLKAGNSGVYMPDITRAALVPGLMSFLSWVKFLQEPVHNELTVRRKYKSSWETSAWHRSCVCSGGILIQVCRCLTTAKIVLHIQQVLTNTMKFVLSYYISGLLYIWCTTTGWFSALSHCLWNKKKYMLVRFQKKGTISFPCMWQFTE